MNADELARRVAGLAERLPEGTIVMMTLTCDRCGRICDLQRERPEGWAIGVGGPPDLCRTCAS